MQNYSTGKYARSRDRMIAGVCSTIAKQTGIDVGLVRIITAVAAVISSGVVLAIYLVAWAVLPMEGETTTVLDDLIDRGKGKVSDYQAKRNTTSSEPGPSASPTNSSASPTGNGASPTNNGSPTGTEETFNPYDEN